MLSVHCGVRLRALDLPHTHTHACRFVEELVQTAHSERVNDMAFPHEFSDVFATCGVGYIRVWHLATCRELLRISVPNLEAHCVTFSMVGGIL